MLLYVVCTVGEFVWNEGGVVPATCYLRLISRCVIFILTQYKILDLVQDQMVCEEACVLEEASQW